MTITLPLENQRWPRFRLLTQPSYNGGAASGPNWVSQPLENPSDNSFGFILANYSRALLPQLGTALIVYRYGVFDGRLRGAANNTTPEWSVGTSQMDLPDLRDQEILIQAAYPDEDGVVDQDNWETVFWGTCEYQLDKPFPAANIPGGEVHYHLIDAFHRTKRWYIRRHGFISGGVESSPSAGHPGYNTDPKTPAQLAGNRDPNAGTWEPTTDSTAIYGTLLTHPGAGNKWTDLQVLDDVLKIGRSDNQPYWTVAGATDLLSQPSAWAIDENETVFSVVSRILDRGRGRGAALPDWTQSSPTGPISPRLKIFAQLTDDIKYIDPVSGSEVTFKGASNASNATNKTVDIIGDHRVRALQLGDAEQYAVDYLEVQGEHIEIMVTLEYSTTLEAGWTSTDKTSFDALDREDRVAARWDHVYTLHRLKRGFKLSVADGNGGSQVNADYRCNNIGTVVASFDKNFGESALGMLELLDDLPMFLGYKIAGDPLTAVRGDSATAAAYNGTPQRREPLAMIRTDDDLYFDVKKGKSKFNNKGTPSIKFQNDGILVTFSYDGENGYRVIGDEDSTADLNSVYDYEKLVFTVGFRSAHRVRRSFGDINKPRKKIISVPNAHLWLAAPNAIYDLDYEANEDDGEAPGLRAGGGSAVILRDDRNMIASVAALAVAWYGPQLDLIDNNTVVHRGAEWTLACCGDIPTGEDYDGGGVVYPKCGEVVEILKANGQFYELNSPVSSVIYDNTVGETTWTCDWQDLDFK